MTRIAAFLGSALLVYSFVPAADYVRPLIHAIDLSEANEVEASFSGGDGSRYHLGIEVDADPRAACLLGAYARDRTCEQPPELSVAWAIRSSLGPVVEGEFGEGRRGMTDYGPRYVLRLATLGPAPSADGLYSVRLSIGAAAPTLADLNPALVADVGQESVLAPIFRRAFARIAGALLVLGSAILGLYSRLRAKPAEAEMGG